MTGLELLRERVKAQRNARIRGSNRSTVQKGCRVKLRSGVKYIMKINCPTKASGGAHSIYTIPTGKPWEHSSGYPTMGTSPGQPETREAGRIRHRRWVPYKPQFNKGGILTGKNALRKLREKKEKKQADIEKKKQTALRITRNRIKGKYLTLGVTARRRERERKKLVSKLSRTSQAIPAELLIEIPDQRSR